MIGYESVVLAALARKHDAKIPENKYIDTGITVVTTKNVDEFWKTVRKNVGIGKKMGS